MFVLDLVDVGILQEKKEKKRKHDENVLAKEGWIIHVQSFHVRSLLYDPLFLNEVI